MDPNQQLTEYDKGVLTIYMEDRVLEAIKKIPLEEQYFLIIVLFLKFVFCYGVELTTTFIFFTLATLYKTPNNLNKYLIDTIMKSLTFLENNLNLMETIINTKPNLTELERYIEFEDYLLILEAKLFVLLANLTCCHGEIFGKQYLTRFNDSEYKFDETKLIELLSPDIPSDLMENLMEKYKCNDPKTCMKIMIQCINSTPGVVNGLKVIVGEQNRKTDRMIGQVVKIKPGVTYNRRNFNTKTIPIDLSGKNVIIFNKSKKYNCLVYANNEWHIGYRVYDIDYLTGKYVISNFQTYAFNNKGIEQRVIFEKNVNFKKNVKPMNCYLVKISDLNYEIVLPEEAFELSDTKEYVENPQIKNAFNNIKEVIQNVFTNQTTTYRNFQDYLNSVAEKEYRTKELLFEMLKLIFEAQQKEPDKYDNDDDNDDDNDENPIVPYALDIVAPVILEGCDVGIRGLRDSMIYLLYGFIDNAPDFHEWLLGNWNGMIDRLNELLRRLNPPVIPETAEQENQVAIYNQGIPNVTLEQVNLILREQETRNQSQERPKNNAGEEERRRAREAREFVRGINETSTGRNADEPSLKPFYVTLGVQPAANQNEIKQAYRKLALQWHPDKWNFNNPTATPLEKKNAEQKFIDISEAYVVLSNENKRKYYDEYGKILPDNYGGKTIKHRRGNFRKGTKYIKTNKKYKKKLPRKTIKKHQKKSSRKRKTRRNV